MLFRRSDTAKHSAAEDPPWMRPPPPHINVPEALPRVNASIPAFTPAITVSHPGVATGGITKTLTSFTSSHCTVPSTPPTPPPLQNLKISFKTEACRAQFSAEDRVSKKSPPLSIQLTRP